MIWIVLAVLVGAAIAVVSKYGYEWLVAILRKILPSWGNKI